MPKKPKILYVTTALHAPPHGGCMIRTANICRQLKKHADLTMLAVARRFVPEAVTLCRREFQPFYQVALRDYTACPLGLGHLLKKWHMHHPCSKGLQAAPDDQQLFHRLVSEHDIVWFHTLGAAHPFKFTDFSESVMDLDDLRHCYYEQYAERTVNLRHRWSSRVQAYKWKRHQQDALTQFDRVIVCSQEDKTLLGASDKIRIIPNGYNAPEKEPEWINPHPDRLGFIGLLHYDPNRDGLIWFRDNVWPLIRQQQPAMTLRIIGQKPGPDKYVEGQGFEYLGFLPETADEMKTWSALVVPITYGGGTRIKILDAFSKKTPVVATVTGAHGIRAVNGKHLLETENPGEFAAHCIMLSQNPGKGKALAQEAWSLFTEMYSWDVIGRELKGIVDELIEGKVS